MWSISEILRSWLTFEREFVCLCWEIRSNCEVFGPIPVTDMSKNEIISYHLVREGWYLTTAKFRKSSVLLKRSRQFIKSVVSWDELLKMLKSDHKYCIARDKKEILGCIASNKVEILGCIARDKREILGCIERDKRADIGVYWKR